MSQQLLGVVRLTGAEPLTEALVENWANSTPSCRERVPG